VDRRKMTEDQAHAILSGITYTMDYEGIKGCDLVIVAAAENIPFKRAIFQNIEALISEEIIIASTTIQMEEGAHYKPASYAGFSCCVADP
jgi:3-hydroxyacyl-CoA dehydrogenase